MDKLPIEGEKNKQLKEKVNEIIDLLNEKFPPKKEEVNPPSWSNAPKSDSPHIWHFLEGSDKLLLNRDNQTRLITLLTEAERSEVKEDMPDITFPDEVVQ